MQDDKRRDWLDAELQDTLDEDYELELEDAVLSQEIARIYRDTHPDEMPRPEYFRELLRLQSELIRLQDWVAYHKEKVVVLFEGRDTAGKGGAIKRITQRLNPRGPRRRPARAVGPRKVAMVFPALRPPPARRRRDRAVRPQLV